MAEQLNYQICKDLTEKVLGMYWDKGNLKEVVKDSINYTTCETNMVSVIW